MSLVYSASETFRQKFRSYATFMFGAVVTAYLGFLDLRLSSSGYFYDLSNQLKIQYLLLGVICFGGALVASLVRRFRFDKVLKRPQVQRNLTRIAMILAVAVFCVLASRPLWNKAYGTLAQPSVPELQQQAHQRVEPLRSYAEQTINWNIWYAGLPVVLMAVVGALLIIKNAFRKGSNTQVLFLVVCLVSGGIYFIQPSIVPDQIWAMRRFLVGVFPALFILASLVLAQVDLVKMLPRIVKVGITLVGALAIMLPPALVSRHYVVRPTYQSQLSQVHAMCDTLEPNDLVIWVGILYKTALQSTRAYCGNDAVGMQEPSAPQLLAVAEEVRQIGKRPVVMLIGNDMSYFPLDIAKLSPISGIDYSVLERVLYGPPKNLLQNQRTIYRGVL